MTRFENIPSIYVTLQYVAFLLAFLFILDDVLDGSKPMPLTYILCIQCMSQPPTHTRKYTHTHGHSTDIFYLHIALLLHTDTRGLLTTVFSFCRYAFRMEYSSFVDRYKMCGNVTCKLCRCDHVIFYVLPFWMCISHAQLG